ncbi:MAG TPA: murein biosynthesis integral membrane protein MurJ [Magnetospirillaceae bacterium]|jgi:putative peptidoglycan lipid II flippase
MTLGRAIATIGGWTVLSRLTGLVREMLVARYLGAGVVADAYFVAFRFPNLFRSLFAEGAFNPAFVPLFAGKLEEGGREAARDFAERCLSVLTVTLIAFVAIMEIIMPWAMDVLAPGFGSTEDKLALATTLSRICFPYLLFISMVSLQSGVLNAMGHFAAAAGTPVLLNVVSVAVLIILAPYTPTPGHAMAWGVFASGIAQFAWLIVSVHRIGMPLRPRMPKLSPEVKQMLKRVVPGAIGAGVYQINLAVNTMIASTIATGAISYLNYAERINQLPLGVVGVAAGTALLPMLSRQIRAGELEAAGESQNRAMELVLLLTLPATAALIILAQPIVALLFQRGHFTAEDTQAVAGTLAVLVGGLPAYVLVKVLTPAFFARHDTRTPVRIAIGTMAVNVVVNLILVRMLPRFGIAPYLGMAFATAFSAWLNVIVLVFIVERRNWFKIDKRNEQRLPRIIAACIVMDAILWEAQKLLTVWLGQPGIRYAALAVLIVLGIAAFGVAAHVFGALRLSEVKSWLRRKPGGGSGGDGGFDLSAS